MHYLQLAENTVQTGNSITATGATAFASVVPILATNTDTLFNSNRTFMLKAYGYLSTVGSPGTLIFTVLSGATTIGTFTTITLPASLTTKGWTMDLVVQIATTGTSGKVSCQGLFVLDNAGAGVTAGCVNVGTGVTGQVTVNTQTAQSLSIVNNFNTASNTIVMTQLLAEEVL